MIRVLAILLYAVFCASCAVEKIPKPVRCQIWVRIDNGPWHCYERGEVMRELQRTLPTN